MQDVFAGMFPRDNPRHTRFAINFFTQIGECILLCIDTELGAFPGRLPE
jgi:hypothetical protein